MYSEPLDKYKSLTNIIILIIKTVIKSTDTRRKQYILDTAIFKLNEIKILLRDSLTAIKNCTKVMSV